MLSSVDPYSTFDDKGNSINNFGDKRKNDIEDSKADRIGKAKRPIHAAPVARGINLSPRETTLPPRALGVSPHRLVNLGLVERDAVRATPGRRRGGPGQHLRAGGPGKGSVSCPRGPPHGSPHTLGVPSPGGGQRGMHLGNDESEEEASRRPWVRRGGAGHRGSRHHGGYLQGPPHSSPGMVVVLLVVASTDMDTDTPPKDRGTDAYTSAEACTARGRGREVSVHAGELVGLGSMALVATGEAWAGPAAPPLPRPVSTTAAAVGFGQPAVRPGPCTDLVVPFTEPGTAPST